MRELSIAVGRSKNAGMWRSDGGDLRGPRQRGRRHDRDPQAAVGGEALLRCEVVDVRLGQVDRQAAGARGGVDQHQRVVVGALGAHAPAPSPRSRSRCAPRRRRRRRPRPTGDGQRARARSRSPTARPATGAACAAFANFEENSPNDRCWLFSRISPKRRDVPERGRAAVAEHDLVALGQREQRGQPVAHPADGVADRRLPVRRTHQRGAGRGQRVEVRRSGSWRGRRRSVRRRAAGRSGSVASVTNDNLPGLIGVGPDDVVSECLFCHPTRRRPKGSPPVSAQPGYSRQSSMRFVVPRRGRRRAAASRSTSWRSDSPTS